jgi:[acyl-carrier-protein] S-malonyltransferase
VTLALLCSGQGRQDRTMLDLAAEAPACQPLLAAAAIVLERDPLDLLHWGSDAELHANRASQVLCTARALAVAAALEPLPPVIVAGYSVGEVAAWGVAGLWPAAEILRLVARRAELMDDAGGPDGGLGFVRGLERTAVERLVARFGCAIAIINPEQVFVIGGMRSNVAACCAQAVLEGAVSARPLAVNVASHTNQLEAAVGPFEAALRTLGDGRPLSGRRLMGASDAALISSAAQGSAGLARQLATAIDWEATLQAIVERGATRLLELGPGNALAEMARAPFPHLDIRAVDDFRTLDGLRAWTSSPTS